MARINTPLTFTVRRRAPELIIPAKPTPRELKPLSDIDDQERLRFQSSPVIMVYRGDPKMRNKNPASVIREALAKLLVFYYPFAGRLREGPAGKLMVDCSGDGVLFIEAEADVTLDQFGDPLQPPFPCIEELIYNVPGTDGILDSPLLLIQMTRLLCGGFIFAVRLNHTMSDATGLVKFLIGLSEIARGSTSPSTLPVWQRELLCSSDRPHVTFTLPNKFQLACTKDDTIHSLFFTTTDISALRKIVPIHLQRCTTFEVLTTCLWRCRAIALQPDPEEMPIIWPVNARYALELVMKAKSDVTKLGYIRSVSNLMTLKARLHFTAIRSYTVSDVTRAGFNAVDFGWGKAAYGGSGKCVVGVSHYIAYTNNKGESGIVVSMCLSSGVMDRFAKELNSMLAQGKNDEALLEHKLPTLSKL
ncbi:hypothetical protein L1987_61080 [Smallanthus sonchifolius]|uniref:Uncharacterized protein n=1 Tax=Smallanthus sonchifolius TaxID=185202 RepID=A0ACB9DAH4_9ASTR|nr:hypothetical protein L1987_61080 [Smallanthus sonchifolius]